MTVFVDPEPELDGAGTSSTVGATCLLGFPIGEPGEPHAVKMVGATKSKVVTTIRRNTFLAGARKMRIDILLRQGVVSALGCEAICKILVKFRPRRSGAP